MNVTGPELAACLTIVAIGAFVQGSIGFGINLIAAPVIALLVPEAVPGGLVLLSLPLTVAMAVREHHHVDRQGVGWIMVGRLPGAAIGAAVVALVATDAVTALVGAAILAAVGLSVVHPHVPVTPRTAAAAGFTAGVMGTAAAVDGPPLALLYQHHHSEAIRATLATCFALGTVMSAVALGLAGQIHEDQLVFTLELLPALALGLLASTWGARHLRERSLRPAVLTFAAGAGALTRSCADWLDRARPRSGSGQCSASADSSSSSRISEGSPSGTSALSSMPTAWRIFSLISTMRSTFSERNCFAFSRPLTELFALVGEPGAGLLHDAEVDADVEQGTFAADSLAVHDVELGLPERRGDLVLHDLHPGAVADHLRRRP